MTDDGGSISPFGHALPEAKVLERVWAWRSCDCCGKAIVLGEEMLRSRLDEGVETVCLGCAGILE